MQTATAGNPPGKIPLLLLPGLLNDAELWRAQIADLSDVADCIVGDQTRGQTLQAVAADVLAQAPPRFALAGVLGLTTTPAFLPLAWILSRAERIFSSVSAST